MMATKYIPEGFHTLTPHIVVKNAGAAIDFYKKAFGAEEIFRMPGPDGKSVMHAEIAIGGSRLMMCEEFPQPNCPVSPGSLKGTTCTLHLYVPSVDTAFNKAVAAGCTTLMPPMDMFWGDRYSKVADPYGHHWSIATHISDPTPAEMQKGMEEMMAHGGCGQ